MMRAFFPALRVLLVFGCAAVFLSACSEDQDTVEIKIGSEEFTIEIADTDAERRQGLMHRRELPADRGMLFVFDRDDYYSFWMKNTSIPLSIAFIDRSGCIREIHDMAPYTERTTGPSVPVRYALEVNQGAFARAGVAPGDCLEIPDPPAKQP